MWIKRGEPELERANYRVGLGRGEIHPGRGSSVWTQHLRLRVVGSAPLKPNLSFLAYLTLSTTVDASYQRLHTSWGAMRMRPGRGLTTVAVSSLMLLLVGFTSMPSADAAAPKGDLLTQSGRSSCAIPAASGAMHGFAVVNETENSERLIVEVSLKGGAPNRSYDVHVVQCQGSSDAPVESLIGSFVTNTHGNGSFHGAPLEFSANVDHVFVGLFGGPDQIYATELLPV